MKIKFTIKSKVIIFPGKAGWHFINIGEEISSEIKNNTGPFRYGFGSVPVQVELGETNWNTSIFPDKLQGYVLPLKKKVRLKENISLGDIIKLSISIRA